MFYCKKLKLKRKKFKFWSVILIWQILGRGARPTLARKWALWRAEARGRRCLAGGPPDPTVKPRPSGPARGEPGQDREVAAVSDSSRVPWGHLAGAGDSDTPTQDDSKVGARPLFYFCRALPSLFIHVTLKPNRLFDCR